MKALFDTIQKMNKGERLYFRRSFAADTSPKYIELYDLILKNKDKDYEKLELKIDKLYAAQSSYIKHQLHQKLLCSLVQCNNDNDEELNILMEIATIKMLYRKNLSEQAVKKWNQTFEKCVQLKQMVYMEMLIQEQLNAEVYSGKTLKIKDYFKLLDFSENHSYHYVESIRLRQCFNALLLIRKRSNILGKEQKRRFQKIILRYEKIKPPIKSSDIEYIITYYTSQALIYFLKGEFELSLKEMQRVLYNFENNSLNFRYNPEFSLEVFRFTSDLFFYNKKYKEVERLLQSIEAINKVNTSTQNSFELAIFLIKNRLYNSTVQYDKADQLLKDNEAKFSFWIENAIEEYQSILSASLAVAFFIANEFQQAYYYASLVIRTYAQSTRQDVLTFIYVFGNLITFEMQDDRLFDSSMGKGIAHFYRHTENKDIGLELLNGLNKCFYESDKKEQKKLFEELLSHLEHSTKSVKKKVFYNYFDFPSWISAKIENVAYRDYKSRKANQETKVNA